MSYMMPLTGNLTLDFSILEKNYGVSFGPLILGNGSLIFLILLFCAFYCF